MKYEFIETNLFLQFHITDHQESKTQKLIKIFMKQ